MNETSETMQSWHLLPGTLCTPAVFTPVLDCLDIGGAARLPFRVDLPTPAAYAPQLERRVTSGDIAIGFSLGALVLAQNLGALQAARAVVLLALNPLADAPENAAKRRAVRDRVVAGDGEGWVDENLAAMTTDRGTWVRDMIVSMAQSTIDLMPDQTELAICRPDATAQLVATDLPLVFVTGAEDQMTPPGPIERIGAQARNAAVRILPGLGHFALLESPENVAKAIRSGLDEVLG